MIQTYAIFVDAYRDLNSRKLFWITLGISALIIGLFALVGLNSEGLTVVGSQIRLPAPQFWYKYLFNFVVGFWVAWGAVVLALVSTAGIFPDLMASGSIDLYFSKPIGRFRLFLTKWGTGLLFTAVQVTVFAFIAYLVFGIRGGQWHAELFLMIPLVLGLYSYLFSMTVLLGVLTRSTVTSLLLTIVLWLVFFLVGFVENKLFDIHAQQSYIARVYSEQAAQASAAQDDAATKPSALNAFGVRDGILRIQKDRATALAARAHDEAEVFGRWHRVAYWISTFLPKTGETVDLLDRQLFTDADLAAGNEAMRSLASKGNEEKRAQLELQQDAELSVERARRRRSVPWVIGTSLAFEAVFLSLAAWLFCRRDY